jgi:hypothetical protein
MFNCYACGESKSKGENVVFETREKTYFEERRDGLRTVEVPVGSGFETVREGRCCTGCIAEMKAEDERQKAAA